MGEDSSQLSYPMVRMSVHLMMDDEAMSAVHSKKKYKICLSLLFPSSLETQVLKIIFSGLFCYRKQ